MEGECHFLDGNIKAKKVVNYVKGQLQSIGIDPGRVEMYNLGASDGPLFAEYARQYTERIMGLGPVYKKGEVQDEAG